MKTFIAKAARSALISAALSYVWQHRDAIYRTIAPSKSRSTEHKPDQSRPAAPDSATNTPLDTEPQPGRETESTGQPYPDALNVPLP